MNRCRPASTRRRWAATALLLGAGLGASLACAQQMGVRAFPPAAKRGMLTVTAPPEVQINGQVQRLAPGVRILGPTNTLVMSGTLVGQTVPVNYVVESSGLVQQVWILSQAEMESQRGTWDTITNFVFGSSADAPKRDDGKTPFDQLPKYPKP